MAPHSQHTTHTKLSVFALLAGFGSGDGVQNEQLKKNSTGVNDVVALKGIGQKLVIL